MATNKTSRERDLVVEVTKKYKQTSTDWATIRQKSNEDQKFFSGEQYDAAYARGQRQKNHQVLIQINRLPNFVQQVENDIRQLSPRLEVHATDELGSDEMAGVIQGIVRHIEAISNADNAYISASGRNGALVPGFGFMKIETDYANNDTFDQEIYIREVKNPFKILPDFNAVKSDFSDAEYWFEFEDISKEKYKETYPKSILSAQGVTWSNIGDKAFVKENQIRLVKYWYKDTTPRKLCLYEDGTTQYEDEGTPQMEVAPNVFAPIPIREFRIVDNHEVKWLVTNGSEILDEGTWHDSEFPFVAVLGNDTFVDGVRDIHGIIRYAKEPQKIFNYMSSQFIRKIAASNKSPWLADINGIPEPMRKYWESSNVDERAILYWDSKNSAFKPERGDSTEPAVQALLQACTKFENDLKATIGIYDAGVGNQQAGQQADQSGIAIQTLAEQGKNANFHFSHNYVLSMKRLGDLIVRLIPKIYDTPRTIRIIGADNQAELVAINQVFTKAGQHKNYDIANASGYDCVIDMGPSFATKKAQQSESMLRFAAAYPQIMPAIADLIAQDLDWDTSKAIADRIVQVQAATMPFLQHSKDNDNIPSSVKAQMVQMQAQLQAANQHVQTLAQAYQAAEMQLKDRSQEQQIKLQIEHEKSQTQLLLKRMELLEDKLESQQQMKLEMLKAELKHTDDTRGHVKDLHMHDIDTMSRVNKELDNTKIP